jgi:hypothetical protein
MQAALNRNRDTFPRGNLWLGGEILKSRRDSPQNTRVAEARFLSEKTQFMISPTVFVISNVCPSGLEGIPPTQSSNVHHFDHIHDVLGIESLQRVAAVERLVSL